MQGQRIQRTDLVFLLANMIRLYIRDCLDALVANTLNVPKVVLSNMDAEVHIYGAFDLAADVSPSTARSGRPRNAQIGYLVKIRPRRQVDHRGWFSTTWKQSALVEAGSNIAFVDNNESLPQAGPPFRTRTGSLLLLADQPDLF